MKNSILFTTVLASLSLAACTASVKGKGGESAWGGDDGGQAKVEGPSVSAPKNSGALQSGSYASVDGATVCDVSISTMAIDGHVGAVYADFKAPCAQQSLEFDCTGNECTMSDSDLLTITLVDGTSFHLNVTSSGKFVTYRKK